MAKIGINDNNDNDDKYDNFFLNDSDIAWFVFVDLFLLNYLKKLLENIKNGQNGMSDKYDDDDKYDKILFKITQILPCLSLLTIFC